MGNDDRVFRTTFNVYRLGTQIGEGGSGRVFRAQDQEDNPVALKLLNAHKASSTQLKRFKNELLFCQANTHPNIIRVLDHGVFESNSSALRFYVMPLYSSSLRVLMAEPLPMDRVLAFFAQLLAGVEAAHLKKVVHRDLKPENVLVSGPGKEETDKLVLADFGIAHFEEETLFTLVKTSKGARLANFQYAAPEQRSRDQKVGPQADIYALGLILNELATGVIPYGLNYKKIGQVHPDYEYLDLLVEKMIQHDQTERFQTVGEVTQKLIGYGKQALTTQKLDRLSREVIPTGQVDDPLVLDPPKLVDADWNHGRLILTLNRPVNYEWEEAFRRMDNYTAPLGKEPEHFIFSGSDAQINCEVKDAQMMVDYFKSWLPVANRKYARTVETALRERELEAKKRLEVEVRAEQQRAEFLGKLQI